jgi:predicted RNase H-like HicB family nuclease
MSNAHGNIRPPDYNEVGSSMERITIESIPIVVGREEDGRWWADIESMPGVMAYGATRESAIAAVRALALCLAADCIDQGNEEVGPALLAQIAKKTGLQPEDL